MIGSQNSGRLPPRNRLHDSQSITVPQSAITALRPAGVYFVVKAEDVLAELALLVEEASTEARMEIRERSEGLGQGVGLHLNLRLLVPQESCRILSRNQDPRSCLP